MTTIYQRCRKYCSLRIRGKLIASFSLAMVVMISALGSITYFTFKDSIGTNKKLVSELTMKNHVLGFHDLVEELQHNISETLFASDLGFSENTLAELQHTLTAKVESDLYLSDYVVTRGGKVIAASDRLSASELQAALPDDEQRLQRDLLPVGKKIWLYNPLPSAMGPKMAAFFSINQEQVWETILHENIRSAGSLFFVASRTEIIMTHWESEEHLAQHETGDTNENQSSQDDKADKRSLPQPPVNEQQLLTLSKLIGDDDQQMRKIGHDYIVASDLGVLDWRVFSLTSESFYIADLIKLKNRIISASAVTFWVSVWIVLIVAHRISSPIISLSAATRDIQENNYSTPLNFTQRHDEVGDLANSFETMRQDIERLIFNDPLTGVFNRRYLLQSMDQVVADGLQENEPVSFIMIDLDRFKSVNDTYGHMAGDAVLKESASTFLRTLGDTGTLARYGGEEFCVLLAGMTATQALEIAEALRRALEAVVVTVDDHALSVTCSLGIAEVASVEQYHQLTQKQVVRSLSSNADLALYHAKNSGRNRSIVFSQPLLNQKAA